MEIPKVLRGTRAGNTSTWLIAKIFGEKDSHIDTMDCPGEDHQDPVGMPRCVKKTRISKSSEDSPLV